MAKRAYSPLEIASRKYKRIPWGENWSLPFGEPELNETWFIGGQSASGKSSFVMQLAKELCRFGKVLYLSLEEGVSATFQERITRFDMASEQGKFKVLTEVSLEDLTERMSRPKSPQFVIVDSFQFTGWTYEQTRNLIDSYPSKSFIFVSQEYKGQPMGKAAVRLRYKSGIKIRTIGYRAYCQGRYSEDSGSFYTIWNEGAVRVWSND